ncbi:hypothetical protein [Paradevosia shaoguanensis]|uniref:Uncharacterized protein n=1 Tax=Paradevosia shaoguanensis TaxID=1335043 RepID=A0AA41QTH2_9HYPH|nr:hypothetical protein [Paradevosia shaoguanensis]MCF1744868.1 hypothetical protein [Paradevosia shaoguanensis]MCI0129351.1 hypothetical protein [Paradevosia shaoguanensis]
MPTKTNMPRLPWQRHPNGGFIAYPHGPEHADRFASIGAKDWTKPEGGAQYGWMVYWKDRFERHGGSPSTQQAADDATSAWWLALERTEGWTPPPPPQIDPREPLRRAARERMQAYVLGLNDDLLGFLYFAYREALSLNGRTIDGETDLDSEGYGVLSSEVNRRFGRDAYAPWVLERGRVLWGRYGRMLYRSEPGFGFERLLHVWTQVRDK